MKTKTILLMLLLFTGAVGCGQTQAVNPETEMAGWIKVSFTG